MSRESVLQTFYNHFSKLRETVALGITALSATMQQQAEMFDDPFVSIATDAYRGVFERGGKMVRGCLALIGYDLFGEANDGVRPIIGAIIEAVQADLLVTDDVQDGDTIRRGGLAAHKVIEGFLMQKGWAEDDATTIGGHVAQMSARCSEQEARIALSRLHVPPTYELQAGLVLSTHLASTARGQMLDLVAAGRTNLTTKDALKIADLKTARYTFSLPLQFGASLAGASPKTLKRFDRYSYNAGIGFQLADDLIGLFGDPKVTGKNPMSDLINGKQTYLIIRAKELSSERELRILDNAKGNNGLTQAEFEQCQEVFRSTGALDEVRAIIGVHSDRALKSIEEDKEPHWPRSGVHFLQELVRYGLSRQS